MERKESKKKERDFTEDESSTLACPIGAYAYCCPQARFQQEVRELDERCLVISPLPISTPKSAKTDGINDPGRNLGA